MSNLAMHTHDFIKDITESGLTQRQAEIFARYQSTVSENLATKHDLELVKHDVELVKRDVELVKKDLTLKLGGMIVASALATTGIILSAVSLMLGG